MRSVGRLRRRASVVLTLGLVGSLVAAPASAVDPAPDSRVIEEKARGIAEKLVGELRSSGPTTENRSFASGGTATQSCFDDAVGDTFVQTFDDFESIEDLHTFYAEFETSSATAADHPAADIKSFCADYQATELALKMRVKAPVDPQTDDALSLRIWLLDTDGGGGDTFVFHTSVLGFQFGFLFGGTEADPVFCNVVPGFDGTWFSASRIPAGCLGTTGRIDIAAMTFDVPGFAGELDLLDIEDLDTFFDVAPGEGEYSGPIARGERPGKRAQQRLADTGRIGTAIKISQYQFPDGAPEVYLARADDYPDALAGGTLDFGPILLVPSCGDLPAEVAEEIERVDPESVIGLGGEAAICEDLFDAAAAGRETRRLAGPTRIETAVAIAEDSWPFGAPVVYLARADNFPDALAGGVLTMGPILLVPSCGDLPDAVARAIDRLDPFAVIALGGAAAVCDDMLQQAGAGRITDRHAGRDRFETAVEISKAAFPFGAVELYLARADNYPDALAGGVLTLGSILLVTTCGDLHPAVAEEIDRLNPTGVVALGGTAAVCDSVADQAASL